MDRIQAIAAAEKLAPYGKSIAEAVGFFVAHLDRLTTSIAVLELCARVEAEFERRLAAGEISVTACLFDAGSRGGPADDVLEIPSIG